MTAVEPRMDFLRGTLELLVLRCVAGGPLHGSGIAARIGQALEAVPSVRMGSLYGRLRRMERLGWLASEYRLTPSRRLARFYRITPAGWKRLETTAGEWQAFSAGVSRFLEAP